MSSPFTTARKRSRTRFSTLCVELTAARILHVLGLEAARPRLTDRLAPHYVESIASGWRGSYTWISTAPGSVTITVIP